MIDQELTTALRERAVAALQISTTMLKVAQNLHQQGNKSEAARLRDEARSKRNESILLMDQAYAVEQREENVLQFRQKRTGSGSLLTDQSTRQRTG